ncbi:LSM-domain-containing protein [Polyplosphaeria fusca]|uniref:LSM2-LSM8 complex subunit LSM8 n=1 Tax=Polyplosphaeria fusca TaxID=682080 RepID=A0A9P4QRT7_9PLEO|nr:LSM-domain-containing protein [Polyplosphaeria fusca]
MALNVYLNKKVSVLTIDGRTVVGTLYSCDGSMNLVLTHTIERVIQPHEAAEPSAEAQIGVYIVRGDSVCVVGKVDEEVDGGIDWTKVRGEEIGGTRHI